MWKSKKVVIGIIVAAVLLIGSLASVAVLAADEETTATTPWGALWEKVAQIYEANTGSAIDAAELETAVQQAQDEIRTQTLQERLQALVDEGKLTQEEADAWLQWQSERPDVPLGPGLGGGGCYGGRGGFGGMMQGWNNGSSTGGYGGMMRGWNGNNF